MGDARPIPEGSLPEGGEAKPEPEVVAAALLMSEADAESEDVGEARPDNVFHRLFANSSPDRSVGTLIRLQRFGDGIYAPTRRGGPAEFSSAISLH